MGEAVVDLYEIDVLDLHLSHRQCPSSCKAQPDLENLPAPGNVVSWKRMAFSSTGDVNRAFAQIRCALGRTEDHRTGSVSLEATVEEPKRFSDHPSVAIVLQR